MRTTRGLKLQASLRKCYWGSSLFFEGKTLVSDDALRISNDGAGRARDRSSALLRYLNQMDDTAWKDTPRPGSSTATVIDYQRLGGPGCLSVRSARTAAA